MDDDQWQKYFEPDEGDIELVRDALTKELHDLAVPAIWTGFWLLFTVLIIDILIPLDPRSYGIFLDVYAGLLFVFPALRGRYVIASSITGNPEASAKLESENFVSTGSGFLMLAAGFIFQYLAISMPNGWELVGENVLSSFLPPILVLIIPLSTVLVGMRVLRTSREKRLRNRREDSEPLQKTFSSGTQFLLILMAGVFAWIYAPIPAYSPVVHSILAMLSTRLLFRIFDPPR